MLDWKIERVAIDYKTVPDIFETSDLLGLKQHRIEFLRGNLRGNLEWWYMPLSLSLLGASARDTINNICNRLPNRRWDVYYTGAGYRFEFDGVGILK